jgi:hypothetical protein
MRGRDLAVVAHPIPQIGTEKEAEMKAEQGQVLSRLAQLEQENKRFRFASIVLLLLFTVVLFVGAAQTGPHTVNANEFVLQDDQGRTRAKLSVDSKKVALMFFDETGLQQLSLTSMKDNSGHGHASLALGERAVTARLVLGGSDPDEWATISDGGVFMSGKGTGSIVITNAGPTSPSLSIMDSQGYSTELGVTDTTNPATGAVQKSSAASIGLVGKDHKVLWSAPTDEKEK